MSRCARSNRAWASCPRLSVRSGAAFSTSTLSVIVPPCLSSCLVDPFQGGACAESSRPVPQQVGELRRLRREYGSVRDPDGEDGPLEGGGIDLDTAPVRAEFGDLRPASGPAPHLVGR